MNCNGNKNFSFCHCYNDSGNIDTLYKQYDNSPGTGYSCCNNTYLNQNSVYENTDLHPSCLDDNNNFLSVACYLKILESTPNYPCNYNNYIGDNYFSDSELSLNYESLYENALIQKNIYNNFFSSGVIPKLENTKKEISCDNVNYIPVMLRYNADNNKTGEYIPICHQRHNPFPNIGTSYTVNFFVDVNSNPCKKNVCLTKYETSHGYNIGEIYYESEKIRKQNHTETNVFIPIMSVFIAILLSGFVYILVKSMQKNKKYHDMYRT